MTTTTTSLTTVHINNAKPPPAHQDGPEGGRHEDETRHRVYVTNFPQGTPEFLLEHFFIHWMVHYFICDVPPVVKCRINNSGDSAVLFFDCAYYATRALDFNGIKFLKQQLQIQRPHDYTGRRYPSPNGITSCLI